MISFDFCLKESGKVPEKIVSEYFEGENAWVLFSKVEKEFSAYKAKGGKEDQPYLYMRIMPSVDKTIQAAGNMLTACFQVEVKERMVEFIEENLKILE